MQKVLGLSCVRDAIILPFATGMALTMSLLTLKAEYDKVSEAQNLPKKEYVIFSRIDQKTCLKSIYTANLKPIVIELEKNGDNLQTNMKGIRAAFEDPEFKDKILCVLSTTSCFAPRIYDDVSSIAQMCKEFSIGHIINSAYGLQCSKISSMIVEADQKGIIDAIVSSTDKNFMVPVGGSIIYNTN